MNVHSTVSSGPNAPRVCQISDSVLDLSSFCAIFSGLILNFQMIHNEREMEMITQVSCQWPVSLLLAQGNSKQGYRPKLKSMMRNWGHRQLQLLRRILLKANNGFLKASVTVENLWCQGLHKKESVGKRSSTVYRIGPGQADGG